LIWIYNMINPANFPDWQFEFPPRSITEDRKIFNFKSPRLAHPYHYNPVIQPATDEALREYEKECYLNQVMWSISQQIQFMQNDIRRQLKIHIDRKLPLPTELNVDLKLKLV